MFKKIFSNTFAQLVAKFFGAGLTLITTYYTIRLAGLSLYGDLTKILVMVAVGFTAIDFGLNAEAIRSSSSRTSITSSLYSVIWARLLLSLIVIIILNLTIRMLPGGYSSEVKNIFLLGSLAIIFQGIYTSCNVWFQYHLSYWRSTISVLVGSLIFALLTIYYLSTSPTLPHLVLANTLGYLAMALTSLLLLPKLDSGFWRLKSIPSLLFRSLPLGLILIASVIASKVDTVILGIFRLSSEVGEYGFAYRIFDVILVLPVFVMNVIYPLSLAESHSSAKPSLIKKTTKYLSLISIAVAVLLYLTAPLVVQIKPELSGATNILRLLALSLPLFYVTAPLMWGLISRKKDKQVLFTYILAAIINTVLNLIYVPHYGAPASAINTGVTELFIFLSLLYFSKNI